MPTRKRQGVTKPANRENVLITQEKTEFFQGPTPPPEVLERYDELVPGTAERLIALGIEESRHRRKLEQEVTHGNLAAQSKRLEIAQYQERAISRGDMTGQIVVAIVSLSCVAGSVYLANTGHHWVAALLASIPTAAVIRAFFPNRHPPKK